MKKGRWKYWFIHAGISLLVTVCFTLVGWILGDWRIGANHGAAFGILFYPAREIFQGFTKAEGFTWPQLGDAGLPTLASLLTWWLT